MGIIFYSLLIVFGIISLVKIGLSVSYSQPIRRLEKGEIDERRYTIVQPILSGDPNLGEDLAANLAQTTDMAFVWLVDEADVEGQAVVKEVLMNSRYRERVTVLLVDEVPQGVNPKIFKLSQAMPLIESEYVIVLDDDSVIDFKYFAEMSRYEQRQDEFIVTGIPYNSSISGWSRLVAAFVNSNSLLTYFSMAKVEQNKTINGMFYILKTEIINKYQVFEQIENMLCDDFEIARFLQAKDVAIIQSTIPCNVKTTVTSLRHYIQLMKRWLVFATIYMEKNLSFYLIGLIVLPSLLPLTLLVVSCFSGGLSWLLVLLALTLKSLLTYGYRRHFFARKEPYLSIIYEVVSDLVLALLYIYALLTPRRIVWRNKQIKIDQGRVYYE